MAKVSVRALRRQLKQERAERAAIADQFLKLDAERDDKLDYVNARCSDLNVRVDAQREHIARLNADLRKEQQFSELVTGCLHGVLGMTMRGQGMPSAGMMIGADNTSTTERR